MDRDLIEILNKNPSINVYKNIDDKNRTICYFEKDADGVWQDFTEREKLKEKRDREQKELERLMRQIAKLKAETEQ